MEESTCLGYTGLHEEMEHLKIQTRLISAKLANVMGEYAIVVYYESTCDLDVFVFS